MHANLTVIQKVHVSRNKLLGETEYIQFINCIISQ